MTLFADVVGQDRAIAALWAAAARPVHAYLLVGPPGTGKHAAAIGFAAAVLCPNGGDGTCDVCSRVLSRTHPDVVTVERTGASISVDEAREIGRLAARSPAEGDRKVLVLNEFHLVEEAAPALLKTIEEPPASTVFVILADHVPADLVTIASRAVRIDFGPVPTDVVIAALVADGVDADVAAEAAADAGGRLDRARLLASDPGFSARRREWVDAVARLDGTGAAAARVAAELLAGIDGLLEPLRQRQAAELVALDERAKMLGERGTGRREVDARHRREQRRVRTDELRAGLAAMAGVYRDRLAVGSGPARGVVNALVALDRANEALLRNPNELLLLQALLVRLSGLVPDPAPSR